MATKRTVNTNFWRDSYVITLNPPEKLVFLYFITSPATSMAGAYEIDLRLVSLDTGYPETDIKAMLTRFCVDGKMYYERGWLVLRNFIKHQSLNPSIKKGIENAIADLPEWLQDKISLTEQKDGQLSLLTPDSLQPDDSLSTDSPQLNRIKLKEMKLNAPTASDVSIDKKLAAREQAARTRLPTDNVVRPSSEIIEETRAKLREKGLKV